MAAAVHWRKGDFFGEDKGEGASSSCRELSRLGEGWELREDGALPLVLRAGRAGGGPTVQGSPTCVPNGPEPRSAVSWEGLGAKSWAFVVVVFWLFFMKQGTAQGSVG